MRSGLMISNEETAVSRPRYQVLYLVIAKNHGAGTGGGAAGARATPTLIDGGNAPPPSIGAVL